jgi:putative protease
MNQTLAVYDKETISKLLKGDPSAASQINVVIGFKEVSRFFEFTKEDCLSTAQELKEKGHKVYLQWDILMTEDIFGSLFHGLKNQKLLSEEAPFDGIRVQDPGLLYALKDCNFSGEIHFITEQGNHNLLGLESWVKVWPERIKRLVVSPQLPASKIKEYAEALFSKYEVELEVLGLGPILLFYTPRKLVSPLYGEEGQVLDDVYKVEGTSEESPHKGFPIIENLHGTFMLNTKDQFIFDELVEKEKDLLELTQVFWRIDPICGLGDLNINQLLQIKENYHQLKTDYARPVTKGFFRVNKTDVLFKKLKNHRLQERDNSFVGEVVDVKKKKHVAVLIKSEAGLSTGDSLKLLSPEGREKFVEVGRMTNALSVSLEKAEKGEIVFIPPVGGISVRSMVYRS